METREQKRVESNRGCERKERTVEFLRRWKAGEKSIIFAIVLVRTEATESGYTVTGSGRETSSLYSLSPFSLNEPTHKRRMHVADPFAIIDHFWLYSQHQNFP